MENNEKFRRLTYRTHTVTQFLGGNSNFRSQILVPAQKYRNLKNTVFFPPFSVNLSAYF